MLLRFSGLVGAIMMMIASTNSSAAVPAWRAKLSPWLLSRLETGFVSLNDTVLIYMRGEAQFGDSSRIIDRNARIQSVFNQLTITANQSQADLKVWLTSKSLRYRSYHISNMVAVDGVTAEDLAEIAQRDDVLRVVGNPAVRAVMPSTNGIEKSRAKGPGQNLVRVGATKVWSEFKTTGEGIVVAGQDTGIRWDHKALQSHYRGWNGTAADHAYNWHDSVHAGIGGDSSCGYDVTVPCDDHDHGTHTIGTVVGDDGAGNQIGMAPGAKWIGCRNMDAGLGNPEMYTECFQWFLAPWPQKGDPIKDARVDMAPHVINNSWGCPRSEGCEGGEFERILRAMRAAGIFVVASAGNDGPGCSTIKDGPAFHSDLVFSVGASDHRTDAIASFSSRGPSIFDNKVGPDVAAPGVNVRSCVRSGGYAESGWSGTSMAGPHLVGMVALLWSAQPKLIGNIEATEELLRSTAEFKTSTQTCGSVPGSTRPNNTFGYGIANVYEAVKAAQ